MPLRLLALALLTSLAVAGYLLAPQDRSAPTAPAISHTPAAPPRATPAGEALEARFALRPAAQGREAVAQDRPPKAAERRRAQQLFEDALAQLRPEPAPPRTKHLLHVRSRATGEPLDPVMVVRALDLSMAVGDVPSSVGVHNSIVRASPVNLAMDFFDGASGERMYVGAPGHAWKSILVDRRKGGHAVVELDPGGELTFELGEDLLPTATPEERADQLWGHWKEETFVFLRVDVEVREDDQWVHLVEHSFDITCERSERIVGLPLGTIRVSVFDVWTEERLAVETVQMGAGDAHTIQLRANGALHDTQAPATLELVRRGPFLGAPFELRLTPMDRVRSNRSFAGQVVWQKSEPDVERGRIEGLAPGRYRLQFDAPRYTNWFTVESGQVQRMEPYWPPQVELTVVLSGTGAAPPEALEALHWMAGRGSPGETRSPSSGLLQGELAATETPGTYRGHVPLGSVWVSNHGASAGWGIRHPNIEVVADGQVVQLLTAPAHTIELGLEVEGLLLFGDALDELDPLLSLEGPGTASATYLAHGKRTITVVGGGTHEIVFLGNEQYAPVRSGPFELIDDERVHLTLELTPAGGD